MENYRISSEIIELPKEDPHDSILNLISLTNNHVWIYFTSGLCQYWNLFDYKTYAPKLINSMKIAPNLFHTFALSNEKIAFYNHIAQRLQVIRLVENKLDDNFWALLPTNNTVGNSERNDDRRIEEIARDHTKFCVFPNTETILVMEKTLSGSTSDSVVSVFKESHCPEPFKQKIHNSNTSAMAALNQEDTIVIYQLNSEKMHIFFVWNIFLDEKYMKKIVIKNDLCCTVISVNNYGIGKFAVWLNGKDSGKPEVAIVEYGSLDNEKKETSNIPLEYAMDRNPIKCFKEDWLLMDVVLYDENKKIALISKAGDSVSLQLISTKTLNPFCSKSPLNSEEDFIDYNQSPSLDKKYYVEYISSMFGNGEDEDDLLDTTFESGEGQTTEVPSMNNQPSQNTLKLIFNKIIPLKINLLYMLESQKVIEKYGNLLISEIIDMIVG